MRVARRMIRANGLHSAIDVIRSNGVAHRRLRSSAPFALITANILARPLRHLSADVAVVLCPGGRLVLSGLLTKQIPMVLNAYRSHGLRLEHTLCRGKWATLILRR